MRTFLAYRVAMAGKSVKVQNGYCGIVNAGTLELPIHYEGGWRQKHGNEIIRYHL